MILVIDVDAPDGVLVRASRSDAVDRGLGGQHRVILIVVAVHAVAADEKKVGDAIKICPHLAEIRVRTEIRGVRLRHPDYGTVDRVSGIDEIDLLELAYGERAHVQICSRPSRTSGSCT